MKPDRKVQSIQIGKRITAVILLLLVMGLVSPLFALPSGMPEEDLPDAVSRFVNDHKETTAGLAVTVFDSHEVLYEHYFGLQDTGLDDAVEPSSVFEWGSVSKLLVWTSVMQQWEAGRIDLEADIRTYVPQDWFRKLPPGAEITMLDLMNHQAGFQDTLVGLFVTDQDSPFDLGAALQAAEPPLIYPPGQITAYSNWGTTLAAYIVEQVSGLTFADYVHEYIFVPLGMNQTALLPDLSDNPTVRERRQAIQGHLPDGSVHADSAYMIPLYPAGMVTGTLEDLTAFGQALLNGDTPLFSEPETLGVMRAPSSFYYDTEIGRNAHGLWTVFFEVPVQGHSGNTAGFTTSLYLHAESGIGLAVMTNQQNELIYNHELPELIFGSFENSEFAVSGREIPGGFFRAARTVRRGPLALYSSVIFPLTENRMSGFSVAAPIEQSDQLIMIQEPYLDLLEVPRAEQLASLAVLLSIALPLIFLAGLILFLTVRTIVRLVRRRRGTLRAQNKVTEPAARTQHQQAARQRLRTLDRGYRWSLALLIIYLAGMAVFVIMVLTYQPAESIRVVLIALTFLIFVLLIQISRLTLHLIWGQDRRHRLPLKRKLKYIAVLIMMTLAVFTLTYGQIFRFSEL